jgi:hypothetical protein
MTKLDSKQLKKMLILRQKCLIGLILSTFALATFSLAKFDTFFGEWHTNLTTFATILIEKISQ